MDSLLNNVSKNRDFFKILCILLLIDIPVITYFNSEMYFSMFKKINNNQDMIIDKTKIISGIIAYLLLAFGLYYFIVNKNLTKNDAFILGIIIYGVYNTTNYFTINNYLIDVAIKDTLWGASAFYLIIWIYSKKMF